jgi:hypothetical protein
MSHLIYIAFIFACLSVSSGYLTFRGAGRLDGGNNEPIVGILSQEISYSLNQKYPDQYKSYIAASYVKFVESAGARVVPIW